MTKIIQWVKANKLASILLLVLAYFLVPGIMQRFGFYGLQGPISISGVPSLLKSGGGGGYDSALMERGIGGGSEYERSEYYSNSAPPTPEIKDRMVVQNANLSLLVKNVSESLTNIKQYAVGAGGYMVSSSLTRPEEAASGYISIRVLSDKLDEALEYLRGLSVKVVSENLSGYDVTDQFVDNEARLAILDSNMARFKEIMAKAEKIEDILRIQKEIFNLQSQIEGIKGRNKYLEATSKTVIIYINLSTDEYTLPYAPSEPWRPAVIFKHAVRSLVTTLRKLGTAVIWIAVYAVVWVPVAAVVIYLRKRRSARSSL